MPYGTQAINSLYVLEQSFIAFAAGDQGLVMRSDDGGHHWRILPCPVSVNLHSIHFPHQDTTGYCVGDRGTILKTEDGGKSWRQLNSGTEFDLFAVKFPLQTAVGFVAGAHGLIMRTVDAGLTWHEQTTATDLTLHAFDFPSDELTGFAVGENRTLLKTNTGGRRWFSQTDNIRAVGSFLINSIHFPAGPNIGFAATTGTVLWTPDSGENWKPMNLGMGIPQLNSVHFRHDTMVGYAVGARGSLFKTVDGGSNWTRLNSGTENDLRVVRFFDDATRGIIGGDQGTILVSEYAGFDWGRPQQVAPDSSTPTA
jgi:photosystem II stability/assembly factor-like uncharacterized protein